MRSPAGTTNQPWGWSKVEKRPGEYPNGECRDCGNGIDLNDSAIWDCHRCGAVLRDEGDE